MSISYFSDNLLGMMVDTLCVPSGVGSGFSFLLSVVAVSVASVVSGSLAGGLVVVVSTVKTSTSAKCNFYFWVYLILISEPLRPAGQ